jgi:hypothetical protein
MRDLMYFGYEFDENSRTFQSDFIKEIKEFFPNVVLKDAFDDIKGYRQAVILEEPDKDNYFSFLVGKGWYKLSLTMQIALRDKSEKQNVDKWLALAKIQYPEAFES